uniref:Uncharacterized protein n=1 Tax=uncultured prokaryote TaxID=198431 RepID=A0A0H5Q5K2_9ZZZZ|nr:hypothetical protein [uncultured prokaryote]
MALYRIPIDLTWNYGSGSPGVNIWHARTTGDFNPSGEITGLTESLRLFYDAIKSSYSSLVDIDFSGEVSGVGPDTGMSGATTPWHVDGGTVGSQASTLLQLVVSWKTGSGGRRGQGRTFIGPLQDGLQGTNGLPVTGGVAAIQTAATALIGRNDGAGNGSFGVWSPTDGLLRDFVAATVRPQFASLRSRRD